MQNATLRQQPHEAAPCITPFRIVNGCRTETGQHLLDLSIVVPIRNERENIPLLYAELCEVLDGLDKTSEILFIDDGSDDGSMAELEKAAEADPRVKVIKFTRNYGQTAALSAGFKYARGEVIVTLDGDLQNDPRDIPRLLDKMAEGYDLVNGWRRKRHDAFITRRVPSLAANWIINKLIEGTRVQLHDFGCTLKAYKRGVVKNINIYGEMHRFIPVFAAWLGTRITEMEVNHRPRRFGSTKYSLSRVTHVILDLVVVRFFSDFLTRPIQFFGRCAKLMLKLGLAALLGLAMAQFAFGLNILSGSTFVILLGLLAFCVLQLVFMGLLAEINIRGYFEGQNKASYVIEEIVQRQGEDC